jgi:hydrogenase nickel incorporation protein HypB
MGTRIGGTNAMEKSLPHRHENGTVHAHDDAAPGHTHDHSHSHAHYDGTVHDHEHTHDGSDHDHDHGHESGRAGDGEA